MTRIYYERNNTFSDVWYVCMYICMYHMCVLEIRGADDMWFACFWRSWGKYTTFPPPHLVFFVFHARSRLAQKTALRLKRGNSSHVLYDMVSICLPTTQKSIQSKGVASYLIAIFREGLSKISSISCVARSVVVVHTCVPRT